MSSTKMILATCVNGVVTADGVPVPSADILSEGIGASSGVLLMDEDDSKYIAKTSTDLKQTLEKLISALDSISSAISAIDGATLVTTCGAGAGTAGPAHVATSDVSAIDSIKSDLEDLVGELL